jgi:hypothetical protein
MEIWKSIKGYEGLYEVSNLGNVKRKGFELKKIDRNGYYRVCLQKNKKRNWRSINRLVAEAFIPNPENKPQVNHINAIKTDNRVENLEWTTGIENIRHARKMGLYPKMKQSDNHRKILKDTNSKKVVDITNGTIYDCVSDLALLISIPKSTLIHYLIGSRTNKTNYRYL